MKINRKNLDWALAAQCKNLIELKEVGLSSATLTRIRQGYDVTTRTAGKLAKALNVPLTRLVDDLGTVEGTGGDTTLKGVTISIAALTVEATAQGLTAEQVLELAGVRGADDVAIHHRLPVAASTVWRIADTLGVPPARLIEKEEYHGNADC